MTAIRRLSIAFLVLFAVPAIAQEKKVGKTGDVEGKVTFNGKPLPFGTITFHSARMGMATSIQKDGTYRFADLPIGEYRITVEDELIGLPGEPPPKRDPKHVAIPKKYGEIETSGLKAKVVPGKQSLNIKLAD
jgi:hypothetical protein